LQLGAVIVFGTLYALSPKVAPDVAGFQPAVMALAAYGLFTIARLVMARRGRLPSWIIVMSAIADILLLLGLIWSFHIQYEQPPSFYLKIPTLLYVFIFISLRALRFDAVYVVVAGAVAAIGWAAMVAYAVSADAGQMMVTKDYVYYMTNNAILIGAEFDKIVSILMVTAVLAVAITRARRLLENAVADSIAAADMSRFLAPEVVSQVTSAESTVVAGDGQMREAAILFLDIRGFTLLSNSMSPQDVIRALTDYQARFTPIIRDHGGVIDKFIGDGIMASFGAAHVSSSYGGSRSRGPSAD
jgi:adenylate cyclase